jgi:hypothetical protein
MTDGVQGKPGEGFPAMSQHGVFVPLWMLVRLEWSGYSSFSGDDRVACCPECRGYAPSSRWRLTSGHVEGCLLAHFLEKASNGKYVVLRRVA